MLIILEIYHTPRLRKMTSSTETVLLFLLLTIATSISEFNFDREPDTILYSDNGRIRGFSDTENKDIVLAAIIPVHQHQGLTCTNNLYLNETLDYVEAFLYSIDVINNDPNLLPNISLGYDIRDSCITESTAIEETVDLVLLGNSERCQICDANGNADQTNTSIPASAIIGSYASFVSIPIANFLRLFQVPQISFSSTSALLANREQYSYFYRTVPSDDQQAQAMIDLVIHFGWTYVSTLHSNDLYGEPGIDRFKQLAELNGICIDLDIGISMDFSDAQYQNVVDRLYNSTPSVIIFFSSLDQAVQLFDAMLRNPLQRKFLWIGSDAWVVSSQALKNYGDIVAGMWGIVPRTNQDPNYYSYLTNLTPSSNKRNPWFIEYYQEFNDCVYNVNCSDNSITSNMDYQNRTYTPSLIDAVFTFAHAVNNFLIDNCPSPIVWNETTRTCVGQTDVPMGSNLRDYLVNTSFTSVTGNQISLNSATGSVDGLYRLLNYQKTNDSFELVTVGEWLGTIINGSKLQINKLIPLQFSSTLENNEPLTEIIQSQCQQCPPGYIFQSVQSSCCGTCMSCIGQTYTPNITNLTECMTCSSEMWGNSPLNGSNTCVSIAESYLDPSDAWGIFLIILALIGLIIVSFVGVAMGIFWNTPIVKASGREQMILLLVGITLSFLSTVFFVIKPSIPLCVFQRICVWLCFSLIVSSLFVKLVRIARIFLRTKTSARPKFIGPFSQVLFTFLLVGGQLILVSISLVVVYPTVDRNVKLNSQNTNNHPLLLVQCTTPHIVLIILQMLYFSALLIASNALAMLTIRFPANFKEVMYVALSTFCIGIIWIAFIITYFATSDEFQTALISFAAQMSAFAVLLCMFAPRVFIMIFLPERNVTELTHRTNNAANLNMPSVFATTKMQTNEVVPRSTDENFEMHQNDFPPTPDFPTTKTLSAVSFVQVKKE